MLLLRKVCEHPHLRVGVRHADCATLENEAFALPTTVMMATGVLAIAAIAAVWWNRQR